MLTNNIMYFGHDQSLPARVPLRSGPLALFFENGNLHHIRCGKREILRRVYVAVRDRNWGTVTPQISNLEIIKGEQDFHITFDVNCQQDEIDFRWHAEIRGLAYGMLNFSMDGEAYSEFWRNRIGICVLHPITECAGQPCEVERIDGSKDHGQFPQFISPHQPFKEIRAIIQEIRPGFSAEVRMEGDTFEMEDQRNWTDASFKTYSTPLDLPFPVLVKKGDKVSQMVQLKLKGSLEKEYDPGESSPEITISLNPDTSAMLKTDFASPLPSLGLGLASHRQPLTPIETERLQALNLAHLRVDLWLGNDGWRSELIRGVKEAHNIDCALEIAIHLIDPAKTALLNLLPVMKELQPNVARWIIFHANEASTQPKWVAIAREVLGEYDPTIPFGCGANANFAELNRNPPKVQIPDFLVFAANPQVHAFDNLSLIENMTGMGETVISAQRLAADMSILVSPVTLKPRFNIVVTGTENEPDTSELPASVDPRQMSLFGAGWTLGCIKYLVDTGVSSVTFYETTGWLGVIETENGSRLPEKFKSIPGMVFPMYHIFADVGEFAGEEVIQAKSSNHLRVESLAMVKGDQTRLLIANLEGTPTQIRVTNHPAQVMVKNLDETNFLEAMQSPEKFRKQPGEMLTTEDGCLTLKMKPYATVRIDTIP